MFQLIKKHFFKSPKLLLFDLSWDAAKAWIFAHISTFIPVVGVIFIVQKMIKDFYSCLGQPFQCITHNYSETLLVIGSVLMLLSILTNRKESENKFAELAKKLSEKNDVSPKKFSETTKESVLKVISKYYQILATERKFLGHVKERALDHFKEIPNDFNEIGRIPEIVENERLFQAIDDAKNRAAFIFRCATKVISDGERLVGDKTTNHDYLQAIEPFFIQFLEHKREIFEHFKQ
jgi:hypothetical protein